MSRTTLNFFLALLILVLVIWLLSYLDPAEIINRLGVGNAYLIIFLAAAIGGVSSFSAAGFYGVLFSVANSGMNQFVLAIFSAVGVLIGDFLFWYFGVRSRKMLNVEENSYSVRISSWLGKKPKWLVPIIIYIYTGFSPLPGDILMFSLALMKYKFREILIPTFLGNYTLALIVLMSSIHLF